MLLLNLGHRFFLHFHAGACARQPAAISLFFQLLVLTEVARRIILDDYKLMYSHLRPQTFATNTHALHAAYWTTVGLLGLVVGLGSR